METVTQMSQMQNIPKYSMYSICVSLCVWSQPNNLSTP